jgi:hypothetical protein
VAPTGITDSTVIDDAGSVVLVGRVVVVVDGPGEVLG